jgi:hypothetical protein
MSPEMPKEVNTDERVTPQTDPVAQPDDAQKTITIDIVRHKLVTRIVNAYEAYDKARHGEKELEFKD